LAGYVECSAKTNENVWQVFKEVLKQVERHRFFHCGGGSEGVDFLTADSHIRRKQSVPQVVLKRDSSVRWFLGVILPI
jgi:hypothetical protein